MPETLCVYTFANMNFIKSASPQLPGLHNIEQLINGPSKEIVNLYVWRMHFFKLSFIIWNANVELFLFSKFSASS